LSSFEEFVSVMIITIDTLHINTNFLSNINLHA